MELLIADRLNIIYGLLPAKGSMLEMALRKEILEKIEFSSKETEKIGLESKEDGSIKWNDKHDKDILTIDFKPKEIVFLCEQVDRLDIEKEISTHLFNICQKIKDAN